MYQERIGSPNHTHTPLPPRRGVKNKTVLTNSTLLVVPEYLYKNHLSMYCKFTESITSLYLMEKPHYVTAAQEPI